MLTSWREIIGTGRGEEILRVKSSQFSILMVGETATSNGLLLMKLLRSLVWSQLIVMLRQGTILRMRIKYKLIKPCIVLACKEANNNIINLSLLI